jgi:hypothetical protein
VTQSVKSDPVALLALGSRMGLQGFEATPEKATSKTERPPVSSAKPEAVANRGRLSADADVATVIALAKSARLQCVADETGAQ